MSNIVDISYKSSDGTSYDLRGTAPRIKNAAFHGFEWEADVTRRQYGDRVDSWAKKSVEYGMDLYIYGDLNTRRKWLNRFHSSIDADFFSGQPGVLTWGSSYIYCFIKASNTYPAERNTYTVNELTIYCPDPFWIQEQSLTVHAAEETARRITDKGYGGYGLSYGYPYSYRKVVSPPFLKIDHYAECDFRLIAYGPAASVNVNIGGNQYAVDYPVASGEVMIIDTRSTQAADRHAYIVGTGGRMVNVFDYRKADSLLMQKIKPGIVPVSYSRTYRIDLTIYKRRSEPAWDTI